MTTATAEAITVEVAYAEPDKQEIVVLQVDVGTTAAAAVAQSGIDKNFPALQLEGADLGIFGHPVSSDQVLQEGDRVEIYRPLLIDPKEIRKRRAAEAKERRAREKSAQDGADS